MVACFFLGALSWVVVLLFPPQAFTGPWCSALSGVLLHCALFCCALCPVLCCGVLGKHPCVWLLGCLLRCVMCILYCGLCCCTVPGCVMQFTSFSSCPHLPGCLWCCAVPSVPMCYCSWCVVLRCAGAARFPVWRAAAQRHVVVFVLRCAALCCGLLCCFLCCCALPNRGGPFCLVRWWYALPPPWAVAPGAGWCPAACEVALRSV